MLKNPFEENLEKCKKLRDNDRKAQDPPEAAYAESSVVRNKGRSAARYCR